MLRERVITGSPVTATFFRSPPSKKPIHRLSGEKNGVRAQHQPTAALIHKVPAVREERDVASAK